MQCIDRISAHVRFVSLLGLRSITSTIDLCVILVGLTLAPSHSPCGQGRRVVCVFWDATCVRALDRIEDLIDLTLI